MGIVAYLDAGSTSMFVGAVAAGGAAVAVAAKVGWRRVAGVFGAKQGDVAAPDTVTEPAAVDATSTGGASTVGETPAASIDSE